jgi:hypothetical protein
MLENQTAPEKEKPSVVTIVIGCVVVAAIGVSLWAVFKTPENRPSIAVQINAPATMSPEEEAYARTIRIENIALSRAENFIHQEVTILNADAVNDGPRSLRKLVVTVEFADDMHQIVLRETRGVMGNSPSTLGPAQRRSFQLSFDRVPASWNMQTPSVQVSYLQFTPLK